MRVRNLAYFITCAGYFLLSSYSAKSEVCILLNREDSVTDGFSKTGGGSLRSQELKVARGVNENFDCVRTGSKFGVRVKEYKGAITEKEYSSWESSSANQTGVALTPEDQYKTLDQCYEFRLKFLSTSTNPKRSLIVDLRDKPRSFWLGTRKRFEYHSFEGSCAEAAAAITNVGGPTNRPAISADELQKGGLDQELFNKNPTDQAPKTKVPAK